MTIKVKAMIERIGNYIVVNGLDSDSRKRELVYQRFYLYEYLRRYTDLGLADIGKLFDRDHSSVHSGLAQFNNLKNDEHFYKMVMPVFDKFPMNFSELYNISIGSISLPPRVYNKVNRRKNKYSDKSYQETITRIIIEAL